MTAGFPRFRLTLLTDAPHASDVNVSVESKSADVGVKTTPTERASTIAIFVAIDTSPLEGPTSVCRWNLVVVGKR